MIYIDTESCLLSATGAMPVVFFYLLRRSMSKVKLVDKKLFVSAIKAAKLE
jgi:hypothetical protein